MRACISCLVLESLYHKIGKYQRLDVVCMYLIKNKLFLHSNMTKSVNNGYITQDYMIILNISKESPTAVAAHLMVNLKCCCLLMDDIAHLTWIYLSLHAQHAQQRKRKNLNLINNRKCLY